MVPVGANQRGLRVAVAVLLAERERVVPCRAGRLDDRGGAVRGVEAAREHGQALVRALGGVVGGAAVVADHAQHRLAVRVVLREGAELARHLRRGGVGDAGEQRGVGAGLRERLGRVVGDALHHEQRAEVGVAEAERAVVVRELRNRWTRVLRHQHGDLEHDRPQPGRVRVRLGVELAGLLVEEAQQVERGEVARGVVEEHVLRARVRAADAAPGRGGVPLVDRRVVLHAGVGGLPGGEGDAVPQRARRERLRHGAVGAAHEVPLAVLADGVEEVGGHAHRVVRVLAGDRLVGLALPVGVELGEVDDLLAVRDELQHAQHVGLGHRVAARAGNCAAQVGGSRWGRGPDPTPRRWRGGACGWCGCP